MKQNLENWLRITYICRPVIGICLAMVIAGGWLTACAQESSTTGDKSKKTGSLPGDIIKEKITLEKSDMKEAETGQPGKNLEKVTIGGGCFWCVEAVFQRIKGIEKWTSGYMGGATKNPTYKEVCSGFTGHAEVVQLEFDPDVITFDQVLEVFWRAHDPTTLNRQGADRGTQYRSVIFYHSEEQKQKSLASKAKAEEEKLYNDPIVTEISPAVEFYPAEKYHQNYFNQNTSQGYCQFVIWPKLKKLGLPLRSDDE